MKWFNVNLTKAIFAKTVRGAIPVVGGLLGGAITFVSFKPCCEKLKASLHDTALTRFDEDSSKEKDPVIDISEFTELSDEDDSPEQLT